MTHTPDEIKKGLELCYEGIDCSECPYVDDCFGNDETPFGAVMPDAIALIQQLQAQNAEKDVRIQQLEAERDAAVADIRLAFTSYVGTCQTCKHGENQVDCIEPLRCGNCENEKCKCQSCDSYDSNWEWRGVQKEE